MTSRFLCAITLTLGLVSVVGPGSSFAGGDDGESDWIRETGDILQIALPVLGGGATFFTNPDPDKKWDKEGTWMFTKAYGTAWGSTYLIKFLASKARPNGDNRTSFPSGHTMSAFAGAGFIDGRFGRAWGIPAYALAVFTGYSRVHSGWHYQDDVLAGASIGLISNWLFTSPLPGKVQLLPTVNSNGYGLTVSVGGTGKESDPVAEAKPRGASFDFNFGPAFVIDNTAGSKGSGDNNFKLSDLDGHNDPTTTAVVGVNIPVSERGLVRLAYGPFEARDQGSYEYDVSFGGADFPAGTALSSSWRHYDLGLYYKYLLLDNKAWAVRGGAGAGIMYSFTELSAQDGSATALVDDEAFYPFLGLELERKFSPKLALAVCGEGIGLNNEWTLDLGASFIWSPIRAWDLEVGYTYFSRQIDTDTYYNQTKYNIPYLSIVRYW